MKAQNKYLLCDDLINLLTKFKISLTKFADEYGLTAVQVHALYILDQQGSVATGKVANALHCDASNVTGIVERLVTSGLVERHEDPDDRRAKKLQSNFLIACPMN
jgi:DNA-binding MarR family transcriptional regulator